MTYIDSQKCLKCKAPVYNKHTLMCKSHHYGRKQTYLYIGKKDMSVREEIPVTRTCLKCDKHFESTGNRRCNTCNESSTCHYESTLSLFLNC